MVENINWLSITEDDVADGLIMNISPNNQRYQFIDFWMWNYLGDAFQIVCDKKRMYSVTLGKPATSSLLNRFRLVF